MRVTTRHSDETRALGEALGRFLCAGDVVGIAGEMGTGKTVFAQGVARGLDVYEPVTSPTFALVHEYRGRLPVWHLDAYRIQSLGEVIDLSWEELRSGGGVILVEWPERIAEALPEERLEVCLSYGDGNTREIEFRARGERMRRVLGALADAVNGHAGTRD